ncbi:MAG TPA: N-acetylmuramidase family protein [Caulobacteraceae bacterium]|jgi:peptidoglycan hydrolase-like protein with peptidoglycan-binding domain|nr:N-acetylmuramidase family protein [Caulobacteraceae bacterium]
MTASAPVAGGRAPEGFIGRAEPLSPAGLAAALEVLGGRPEALWTVVKVETSGRGFLPDRRPQILFERHEFSRRTAGRFDASHPEISGKPGGYGAGGAHQHDRLLQALSLHRLAALESASWGLGQILGYNAGLAGHSDAEGMVAAFCDGEDQQILGMARFLRSRKLDQVLTRGDWAAFARGYNGPGYAANRYDEKLAASHSSLLVSGLPDLELRAVQLRLTYEGLDPGPVDGVVGVRTRAAAARFRALHGLTGGEAVDEALAAALRGRSRATAETSAPDRPRVPTRIRQALLAGLGFDVGPVDDREGPLTRGAVSRAVEGGAASAELITRLRAIAPGSASLRDVVRQAQRALQALGFEPGADDGLWGPRTQAAATAFRAAAGLPQGSGFDAALAAALLSH